MAFFTHFFAQNFNQRILTAQKNSLLEGTPGGGQSLSPKWVMWEKILSHNRGLLENINSQPAILICQWAFIRPRKGTYITVYHP